jgi:hypothetical protein
MDAKSMGYSRTRDSNEFVKEEHRKCWSNGRSVQIFKLYEVKHTMSSYFLSCRFGEIPYDLRFG